MIKKINHIGIAVTSLEAQIPFYRDVLGFKNLGMEEVPDQKVKVAMFEVGEVKIELLEPTAPDSPIAKFLEKKGDGIHHIAYETDGIVNEIKHMEDSEIQMLDKIARDGAHGTKIAFLHPKSSGRVLTEICQPGTE
ncbi:MAG: methylmalonyl-CoA epimerase [Spirochaetales bacterium]|nr:methylmalonyl-CoA epimerase [Spirochaetales bacterium]